MFHTYIASVCSKCSICFRLMLHSSVSCCKCFVFQRYVQRVVGAQPGTEGRADKWGTLHAWGPADGTCSSSSQLLGPARAEREEGVRRGRARRTGAKYACVVRRDKQGKTAAIRWEGDTFLLGHCTFRCNLSSKMSERQQFPKFYYKLHVSPHYHKTK
jgi:hypothetical protein